MAELLAALKTLTVVELQSELKTRGLKKSGNKAALIKRLEEVSKSFCILNNVSYSCIYIACNFFFQFLAS